MSEIQGEQQPEKPIIITKSIKSLTSPDKTPTSIVSNGSEQANNGSSEIKTTAVKALTEAEVTPVELFV